MKTQQDIDHEAYSTDESKEEISEKKYLKLINKFIRHFLALFIWSYIIIKVFIYDIDILIIEKLAPDYRWIINYKFVILISILAVLFALTKNKKIIRICQKLAIFPLYDQDVLTSALMKSLLLRRFICSSRLEALERSG